MKKTSIIFCVALAAFSLEAFGIVNWNDSATDQVETSVNEAIASNEPVTGKINTSIFCDSTSPGPWETSHWGPSLPVDPVKQAAYEGGMEALMEYLKENSREARAGQEMDKLQPFKLVFTVTKNGTIENVRLDGTSGYLAIDYRMIDLILKAPGKWEPAENSKGEKVDQEQVVALGPTGC
ncbi:energy transducer TonB [Ulvibacterium sp.]|uniref:energy transducer TonB n=1 Tax=Ulvibacterium sp. TaxID=2665914 RepID=UPI003BAA720D